VGNGRHVPDAGDHQPSSLQRPYCRFSSGSGSFDHNVHLTQSLVHSAASDLLASPLGSESGPFAGTFETNCPCAGRGYDVALRVRNTDQSIIERGIDICAPMGDVAAFSPSGSWSCHNSDLPTSWRRSGDRGRQRCGAGLFWCGHWCGFAGRGREGSGDGAGPGKSRFQLGGGCSG